MTQVIILSAYHCDSRPIAVYGSLEALLKDYPSATNEDHIEKGSDLEFQYHYANFIP